MRIVLIAVFCLATGIAIGALAFKTKPQGGAAAETKSADKPVNWKMGSAYPGALVQLGSLGKDLSSKLGRVSGGSIKLRFYEPGALVPPPACSMRYRKARSTPPGRHPATGSARTARLRCFLPCPSGRQPENTAPGIITAVAKS